MKNLMVISFVGWIILGFLLMAMEAGLLPAPWWARFTIIELMLISFAISLTLTGMHNCWQKTGQNKNRN